MSGPSYDQRGQKVDEQYNAGRDINIDARREEFPYVEQEEFQSAGCLARAFVILGGLLMAGGFLAFLGGILMTFMNVAQAGMSEQFPSLSTVSSSLTIAPIGFGVMVVGMILFVLGRLMGRSAAYKNRVKSQRNAGRARY